MTRTDLKARLAEEDLHRSQVSKAIAGRVVERRRTQRREEEIRAEERASAALREAEISASAALREAELVATIEKLKRGG